MKDSLQNSNSSLKMYSCKAFKPKDQCIGVLEVKNKEIMSYSNVSSSIDGQYFVACGVQTPTINNYEKMEGDQLKFLPYCQNYLKGCPSKVNMNFFYFEI